jgi:hypothetical protein
MPEAASIDRHMRRRQIELARSIASRKKVYLDLRFWIIARNVVDGTDTSASSQKLLHLLRRGVGNGTLICPTSESTVLEVMKQANTPTRRHATASLIDELSLGVSLTSGPRRVATEFAYFFHQYGTSYALEPQDHLVWTKLAYALGERWPSVAALDADKLRDLQVGFFDKMWETNLSQMLVAIGDAEHPDVDLSRAAKVVAAGIKDHADTLVSYVQTYRDEVVGAIDGYGECTGEIMASLAERAGVVPIQPGSEQWDVTVKTSKALLINAIEKPEIRSILRTIHALASLHAGLRWDRQTKFVANHFYDFEHAAGAVAYCDAFFTEGFLSQIANAGHVQLTKLNCCRVTNRVDEAVEILKSFSQA